MPRQERDDRDRRGREVGRGAFREGRAGRRGYKLTLASTPGVTLAKTVWSAAAHDADHLDPHELAITMKLTAAGRGDYAVHGRLDFAVCKIGSQCLPKSMPIAVLVAAR